MSVVAQEDLDKHDLVTEHGTRLKTRIAEELLEDYRIMGIEFQETEKDILRRL